MAGPDPDRGPDLLGSGAPERPPRRRPGRPRDALLLVVVVALAASWLIVTGRGEHVAPPATPSTASSATDVPAAPAVAVPLGAGSPPALPALVLRTYNEVTVAGGARAQVSPGGASTSTTADRAYVLDVIAGRAVALPLPALQPRVDLGAAAAVVPGASGSTMWRVSPDGRTAQRVTVPTGRPLGDPVAVPTGWRVAGPAGSDALVVARPVDERGHRAVAVLGPGGRLRSITPAGYLLGAADTDVLWLDPACPASPGSAGACRLHVDPLGSTGADRALDPPPGLTWTPGRAGGPGPDGVMAVPAAVVQPEGLRPVVVRVPAAGTPTVVSHSAGASVQAGLTFAADGTLVFGVTQRVGQTPMRPAYSLGGPARLFGDPEPPEARVLCSCGPVGAGGAARDVGAGNSG